MAEAASPQVMTWMTTTQWLLICFTLSAVLASAVMFLRNRPTWAAASLLAAALAINILAAGLDPFLNDWDERYHALVARNMLDDPFKPVLRADPVFDYDYRNWSDNQVWLHKQPLFLWQIATSFAVFGVHEWSLRLPVVLMTALLVPVLFRMGTLIANTMVGYAAALLFTLAHYRLELVSGAAAVDHNDLTFLFYITLSLWCLLEYFRSPHWRWVVMIGIFSGAAILTKWLVGLLVYAGWGVAAVLGARERRWRSCLAIVAALALTGAIVLPWQFYILAAFPAESRFEFAYNRRHLFEQLESHTGDWSYHLRFVRYLYGSVVGWLIPLALIAMYVTVKRREFRLTLFCWLVVVYAFFSIAAMKMPTYVYVVSSIMYLAMGCLLYQAMHQARKLSPRFGRMAVITAVLILGVVHLDLPKLLANHSGRGHIYNDRNYRPRHVHNREVYRRLGERLSPRYVVMNVKPSEFVEAMFYSNLPAYDRLPTAREYATLMDQGRLLAVFDDGSLPAFLNDDDNVVKLRPPEFELR